MKSALCKTKRGEVCANRADQVRIALLLRAVDRGGVRVVDELAVADAGDGPVEEHAVIAYDGTNFQVIIPKNELMNF